MSHLHDGSEDLPGEYGDDSQSVAIIGMACRFPDADTPARFWSNLVGGRESITVADGPDDGPDDGQADGPDGGAGAHNAVLELVKARHGLEKKLKELEPEIHSL